MGMAKDQHHDDIIANAAGYNLCHMCGPDYRNHSYGVASDEIYTCQRCSEKLKKEIPAFLANVPAADVRKRFGDVPAVNAILRELEKQGTITTLAVAA